MRDGFLVLTIVLSLISFRGLVTVLGAGVPSTGWVTASYSYFDTYTPEAIDDISRAVDLTAHRTSELLQELDKLTDDQLNLIAESPDEACAYVLCEETTAAKVSSLANVMLENRERQRSEAAQREMGRYSFWLLVASLSGNAISFAGFVLAYRAGQRAARISPIAAGTGMPDIYTDARGRTPGP